jgi:predicted NBD/HSP70 family sugar kinase
MPAKRNTIRILDSIRKGKNDFSKKDIHRDTGMAWGTMCNTVGPLLEKGYVFARKEVSSGRGRPVVPLCVNNSAAYFMGIDIGADSAKIVVCDLGFNFTYRHSITTRQYETPEAFYSWLFRLLEEAIVESGIPSGKLQAIGVAFSGNVDSEKGLIVSGGNLGMAFGTNLAAAEELSDHFDAPALIVPTHSAASWAEYHFGAQAGTGNLVTIGLGVGIGSGVVSNHNLLLSHPNHPIGYIGHMLIPGNKYVCSCGFRGCLEAYSGAKHLAQIAAEKLPDRPELHSAEALDRAAQAGDADAVEIMSTAASYNAVGIASMIQLYSPEALIFLGGQSRRDGFLLNRTIAELKTILPAERRENFSISLSALGTYASAMGAARLAYEKRF